MELTQNDVTNTHGWWNTLVDDTNTLFMYYACELFNQHVDDATHSVIYSPSCTYQCESLGHPCAPVSLKPSSLSAHIRVSL